MSKIVVIYKSKYGSAKKYAQWIADEAGADIFEKSEIKFNDILKYDTVVYGGSLYAAGISGISVIKNNFDKLKDKKIIIYTVGASPAHPNVLEHIKNSNFTKEMIEKVNFFHLRGGFNYKKLNFIDKILMSALKKKIQEKRPDQRTADEQGMLESFDNPTDWTNKDAIKPIIEYIKM